MRNLSVLAILVIVTHLSGISQVNNDVVPIGIQFHNDLTFKAARALAKQENRYLFVDCYTTWCGPCRYMRDSIFSTKKAGEYMNERFVCTAIQMDKTSRDSKLTKKKYKDAFELSNSYEITAYPTFLIFNSNGVIVHRIVGATGSDVDSFIVKVSDAFVPEKQYYVQQNMYLRKILERKDDTLFVMQELQAALSSRDYRKSSAILDIYLSSIRSPLTKENIKLIERVIHFAKNDPGMTLLLEHIEEVRCIDGNDWADGLIRNRIACDELAPLLDGNPHSPKWSKIRMDLVDRYPSYADRVIAEAKPNYYLRQNDFKKFGQSAVEYVEKYQATLSNYELNSLAWDIFLHVDDKSVLAKASDWSKTVVDQQLALPHPSANYIDTYANILFKLGDQKHAIFWEREALKAAAGDADKAKLFNETIAKMSDNIKTWN